jgi:hypothetical protein
MQDQTPKFFSIADRTTGRLGSGGIEMGSQPVEFFPRNQSRRHAAVSGIAAIDLPTAIPSPDWTRGELPDPFLVNHTALKRRV